MTEQARIKEYVISRYNEVMNLNWLYPYYGGSDYMNFGYFEEDTRDQREACDNLVHKLLDFIPDKSGNLLEVACGKGQTTAELAKYYPPANITAINIAESQLDVARRNAPDCRFLLMDAAQLDFPDASFDNIICVEAVFHFHTRETFLREALRVLVPGGRLVLSDILMTYAGEERRESRTVENFVPDLDAYAALYTDAGYTGNLEIVDVTEQSWHRHYRCAVQFGHERFLRGEVTREEMEANLEQTYRRVPDMRYYLLASAQKP